MGRCVGVVMRGVVAAAMVVAGLVIPVTATVTALASVSNSQDLPPTYANWPKNPTNWPCYATPSYACTQGGYDNSSALASGWPNTYYGQGIASTNKYGMHNCTLYAAYRLEQNGFNDPGNWGNASMWAKAASRDHILVNQTPAVGAIAQWNAGAHGDGHVAYVESVSYDSTGAVTAITITEDNFMPETGHGALNGGYTAEVHITAGAPVWPANFIHAKDQWSINLSANPAGATNGQLHGIACPSASSCFAAGSDVPSPGPDTSSLIEHWNGSIWAAIPSPDPSGAIMTAPASIVCPAHNRCLAVGLWATSTGPWTTYAEGWNGTTWTLTPIPNPASSTQSDLLGVACATATSCFAVGSYVKSSGPKPGYHSLIEHWNGTRWSIVPSPTPSGVDGQLFLNGIACPGAANCTAVGHYQTATLPSRVLIESWNGSAWSLIASPRPPGAPSSGQLNAIACSTTTNCDAVGYYSNPGPLTLAEHWNGSAWSITASPNPTGAAGELNGIACTGTTCDAVGTGTITTPTTTVMTLVERWNGTNWAIVPSPNVPGASASQLNAVACPATTCDAVGSASGSVPLAEIGAATGGGPAGQGAG